MRKMSKAMKRRHDEDYGPARVKFLRQFARCELCIGASLGIPLEEIREITHGEHAERAGAILEVMGARWRSSTEVHHQRGRTGRLLADTRYFIASCRGCREWPHENQKRARLLNLLSGPNDWMVYDRSEGYGLLTQDIFDKIEEIV